MAKQTINIGSAPNDNTGDLLRDAFDKVNQNFDEIYSERNVSDKISVGNSTVNSSITPITVSVANSTINAALTANSLTIGTTVIGSNSITTDDMTVYGDLNVLGVTTTINTIQLDVADINITIAKNAPNPETANGAGITIAGANASINYYSDSNTFTLSHPIKIGSYIIDGASYSGTANSALYIPANNGIISNSTGVFVDGNTGLVVNATGVHVNSSYVQNTDSRTLSGDLTFSGNSTFTGQIQANTVNATSISFGNSTFKSTLNSYAMVFGPYDLAGNSTLINTNMVYILHYKTGGNVVFTNITNYSLDMRETGGGKTTKIYLDQSNTSLTMSVDENQLDANDYVTKIFVNTSIITLGTNTVNSSINSTAFSGTANNSDNLGGVAAASYVQNTDSRTLSGNLTFSGANTTVSSNTLNLGTSTVAANGYTYLPNGLKLNWGSVSANSTDGSVTFVSAFGTALLSITATSDTVNTSASITAVNTTSATIYTSSDTTSNVYYMAIGY